MLREKKPAQESFDLSYSLGHVDQSHTNNGFFKLVEPLLQIYSCFFSHSI